MTNLTQAIVHELLLYDPFTGSGCVPGAALVLRRRAYPQWRDAVEGTACTHRETVCAGHLSGQGYQAHRVIWLYMLGVWPHPEIDHINRKGADNRWSNHASDP